MPLPQNPPSKGAQNRRVHFPFVGTPKGYSWEAHIAGPCHWFDCHRVGRHSKPCLCEMTSGELVCDRDHDIDEPYTLGYQPLYAASNGKPGFVCVYDYGREQIDKLKLHHVASVTRGKGTSDTVSVVHHRLNAPLYHSTRADLMRPADLTESLLRIWKIPELIAWYRSTHGLHTNAPPPTQTPPPVLTGAAKTAAVVAAARKTFVVKPPPPSDPDGGGGNVGAEVDAVIARAQWEREHRKNGHLSNGKK